jgi:hypothetical protein
MEMSSVALLYPIPASLRHGLVTPSEVYFHLVFHLLKL